MRRMQILRYAAFAIPIALLAVSAYLYFFREYEIAAPENNAEIKLFKNMLSDDVKVIDNETRQTIFCYQDGYGLTLEKVEKLPEGKWKVTLKDHTRGSQPR